MALKIKPPTHRADAPGVFISLQDPAWENDLYEAEITAMHARALKAKQDAAESTYRAKHPEAVDEEIAALRGACTLSVDEKRKAQASHPVDQYACGLTRFQPGADGWDPDGKACTVRGRYLKPGACEFVIRRLRPEAYHLAASIENSGLRLMAFARQGLRAVASPDYNWTAEETDTRAPDEVIRVLHDSDPALVLEIGQAVINLCSPLRESEAFR